MPKSLFDIMDSSDDCIIEFEKACTELCEARYILAEQKISQLLQVIAKSKKLYALISACMQEFDFGSELNLAKTPSGLILPESRKKRIAFVFCLLYSFDTNQTDFKKFLHTFFPNDEINVEYAEFVRAVIVPFSKSVLHVCSGTEPDDAENDSESFAPAPVAVLAAPIASVSTAAPAKPQVPATGVLDALAIQSLSDVACEIIGIVARDSVISDKVREELMLVCEAFDQAVKIGVEKAIRTMYVGLKYTVKCSPLVRQLEVQSENLERLIAEYDLD